MTTMATDTGKRGRGMAVSMGPKIDPFRGRQVPDVAGRFLKERDAHQRHADLMWLGAMAALFSDHELQLLADLGFLSLHDRDLLKGRLTGPQVHVGVR